MSNRKLGIIIWGLCFALAMVLMFCLERGLTATFWVTLSFVCIAFISSLLFQIIEWKRMGTLDKQVLRISGIIVSDVYVLVQVPTCGVFSYMSNTIPVKTTIIVNASMLILAWILIVASLIGVDHTERTNQRQRNNHTTLLL